MIPQHQSQFLWNRTLKKPLTNMAGNLDAGEIFFRADVIRIAWEVVVNSKRA